MHSFEVKDATSLLPFLFESFPKVPRTRVKKWLSLQCVSVNGRSVTQHDFSLSAKDRVEVMPGKKTLLPKKSSIKIVYEDPSIIVIEKPSGLLTIATEKIKTKTAYFELNDLLQSSAPGQRERAFIVHRLDRETSGLLVFARNEEVKHQLQKEWDKVEKHYYAVVEGTPAKKKDTLKSHLAQNTILRVYSTEESEHTKFAVTHYRLVKSNGKFSLLDVRPETGRKNQIRVQLADIGHPIAGDKKYGSAQDPAGRLALHAYSLSFKHPVTHTTMEFKSELPQNLLSVLK